MIDLNPNDNINPNTAQYINLPAQGSSGLSVYESNPGLTYLNGSSINYGQPSGGGQTGVLGTNNTRQAGGGGGGTSAPAYDQSEMDSFNEQETLYNRLLQSLNLTEQEGKDDILKSYNKSKDNATLQNDRAVRDFDIQRTRSQDAKNKAVGTVDTNNRTLADSVRRILGIASGSGSSAYKLTAPGAIARKASGERSNVLNSYGMNEMDLDTAVKDTGVDFASLLQELSQKKADTEESFMSGIIGQRQGLTGQIGQLQGDRARLTGGDPSAAAKPYRDQYLGYQNQLDALPGQYNNNVTGRDLKVSTPELRDYTVDRQAVNASRGSQQQYSPYSKFLLNRDDEEELRVR